MSTLNLKEISKETLAELAQLVAKATTGMFVSTGLTGIDLSPYVSQVPVNVPARNNTSAFPRVVAGMGSTAAQWVAQLNINNQQTTPRSASTTPVRPPSSPPSGSSRPTRPSASPAG